MSLASKNDSLSWAIYALVSLLFAALLLPALGSAFPFGTYPPTIDYYYNFTHPVRSLAPFYVLLLALTAWLRPRLLSPSRNLFSSSLFLVFAPCLLLYLSNGYSHFGGDTTFNCLIPRHILEGNAFPFDASFVARHGMHGLLEIDGGYVPIWPVGTAIFAFPAALLQHILGVEADIISAGWGQKVSCAFLAAFSSALVFAILYVLTKKIWVAALFTLAFACGSSHLIISSATLWQHGPVTSLVASALLLLSLAETRDKPKYIVFAAIPLSLLFLVRPQASVFYLAGFLYAGLHSRSVLLRYLLYSLPGIALFFAANLLLYKHLLGGYQIHTAENTFANPLLTGILGHLLSPNRGLLVFSPFLLLALPGLREAFRSRLLASFSLAALGYLLLHAKFTEWWGGWTVGPRFSSDLTLILTLLAAVYISSKSSRFWNYLASLLVFISILIVLPAYYFLREQEQWSEFPDVDRHNERIWTFSDWLPYYFRHRLALQGSESIPAYTLARNKYLGAVPAQTPRFRVKVNPSAKPIRTFRLPRVGFDKGQYQIIVSGENISSKTSTAHLYLNVMNEKILKLEKIVSEPGLFVLEFDFPVILHGELHAILSFSGDATLLVDTFQIIPLDKQS